MTKDKKHLKNILFSIATIILSLIIIIIGGEIICRINYKIQQKNLNSAQKSLDYGDIWSGTLGLGGYLKPNLNSFVIGGYGKKVRWKNNSQGFRYDRDIEYNHDKGVIRILSLGDSFTGGYRIGQEQTFSRLLEKYFIRKENGKRFEVIISVINEPFAGLIYLSNLGIKFNSDIVILGITLGNDIVHNYITSTNNDCYVFDKATETIKDNICLDEALKKTILIPTECLVKKNEAENKTKIHSNNISVLNYSMLYKMIISFLEKYAGEPIISCYNKCIDCKQNPRMFDICTGFDIFLKSPPIDELSSMLKTLGAYNQLSKQYSFKLIVIIFPQRFQVQKEDWEATVEEYGLNEDCFDLMKPNNLISSFCKREGINYIDPTLDMAAFYNKKRKSLYFPLGDMHFNALGNKVLYDTIKEKAYQIINESL